MTYERALACSGRRPSAYGSIRFGAMSCAPSDTLKNVPVEGPAEDRLPRGPLDPAIKRIAKRLHPHTRRVVYALGFSGGGALALPLVTLTVLWGLAHMLAPFFGGLAPPMANLLVYGPPLSLNAMLAFAEALPIVATILPSSIGAAGGAVAGWVFEARRSRRRRRP